MEQYLTHVHYASGSPVAGSMPRDHAHKLYEIYFLVEGSRTYYTDDTEYDLKPGDFALIYPGKLHKTGGGSYKRILLNITPEFFPAELIPYVKKCFDRVLIKPPGDYMPKALETFEKISRETSLRLPGNHLMAQALISQLIVDLYRFAESGNCVVSKKDNTSNRIIEIISYINENYKENFTIDSLASMAFISRSHFCHQFKRVTNCSPIDYLNSVRLNAARHLLESTSLSISQIAEAAGFSGSNYFGDIFLKRFGISPREYRRENSQ
jgi:AraC-like DNA-binding protein